MPRVDAIHKVTGRAKFTGDLAVPGLCEGRVLRSTVSHGRIRRIDVSRAEALDGVIAVLTGADLHGLNPYYGSAIKDRPAIAIDRVRYIGEPVAAVAAVDVETADRALELIDVEYDELPAVWDVEEALKPGAPVLHQRAMDLGSFHDIDDLTAEGGSNVCYRRELTLGDVNEGFAAADVIYEDEFTFPAVYHYAMEPYTCIAEVTDSQITIWSSAQHPYVVRADLANMFGVPFHQVRVIIPYVGGGYGSKSYTKIEPLVAALARKARRPVRVSFSVEEAMLTNRRHFAKIWLRTGVTKDGILVAKAARVLLDTGAYADNGPRVANKVGNRILGAYRCPNIHVESIAVYTNTTPAGSFRAIGGPQAVWAVESQMDRIAADLGIDPAELRRRNLLRKGDEWKPGSKRIDGDLPGNLDKLTKAFRRPESSTRVPGRGRGLALGMMDSGAAPVTTAIVRMHSDGSVTVLSSTTEIGQGAKTVFAQIASQELGVPMTHIQVVGPDTFLAPFDRSTGASRSTTLMGTAVLQASREVAGQLRELAAEMFGCSPEDVSLGDGKARAGEQEASLAEVVQHGSGMPGGELIGRGAVSPGWGDQRFIAGPVFFEFGIAGVELRVDEETGAITIERLVSLADVGHAINPALAEGQEEGAAMMGIGHTLFEEMKWEAGQLINGGLVDYRVPSFADLPLSFESIMVQNGDGPGPYGAKGVGEAGLLGIAPAIAAALEDALGVRIRDLPLTAERVWRALRERNKSQKVSAAQRPA